MQYLFKDTLFNIRSIPWTEEPIFVWGALVTAFNEAGKL